MMKVILVNERLGHTRTYVIRGWLKSVLSLCLLGAPVALGHLGYQLSLQAGATPAPPVDATAQHPVLGAEPTEMQLASPSTGRSLEFLSLSAERKAPSGRHTLIRNPAGHVHSVLFANRRPPARFRYGRAVDPATYQRHAHS